jgi:biopolymer transport protein ExbD
MKNEIIIGFTAATILIAGCGKKNSSSSNPDTTKTATQVAKEQIVIKIAPDKTLLVADKPCLQSELVARLTELEELDGKRDKEFTIYARGDIDDNQIKEITAACKKVGVHDIHYNMVKF